MHGFFDVVIGSIMGAALSAFECIYSDAIDSYLYSSPWHVPCAVAVIIIGMVRIHPEPADDCPCFDDSVAFAGVMIGVELGGWHYAQSGWAWNTPMPGTVPFNLEHMGWTVVILRIFAGVLSIFAWREIMKPTLLKVLPHIFRVIERLGLSLPRKFFMQASEYNKVPAHLKVDNVLPSMSDIPSLLGSIRRVGRARAVSVGPQSAADAYETLAYREKRRKDSVNSSAAATPILRNSSPGGINDYFGNIEVNNEEQASALTSGFSIGPGNLPTPAQSRVGSYEQMMGQSSVLFQPTTPPDGTVGGNEVDDHEKHEYAREEREMFSRLEKPRVRYDVEVVTKLIVYAGIAWLAVEINPIFFEVIGLGMGLQEATITASVI